MTATGLPTVKELSPAPDATVVARALATLPGFFWLDSAEKHPTRGRYSYIAAEPNCLHTDFNTLALKPFVTHQDLPPFQGGYAGYLSYDFGQTLERVPQTRFNEFAIPTCHWGQYDCLVSFDHVQKRAWLVAQGPGAEERIEYWQRLIEQPPTPLPYIPNTQKPQSELAPQFPLVGHPNVTSDFHRHGYLEAVAKAVEYTHAGDCFQVNLSQRLLAPLVEPPFELYIRLRSTNPAPFACYFNLGDTQILSTSPERFLQVCQGEVVTRPIKGTRRRGSNPREDEALQRDLDDHPKDRAENVMIVDLLRNDLGRVCEFGSVTVPRMCEIEAFKDVHHLVSEVRGRLRADKTVLDLLLAAFPGGSITGAPKVRAMEIIAELEPTARAAYCGSAGFIGYDGTMDTNILIRTMTANSGWVQFPVGGGIVADSDPKKEYDETLHKAAGLLRALQS